MFCSVLAHIHFQMSFLSIEFYNTQKDKCVKHFIWSEKKKKKKIKTNEQVKNYGVRVVTTKVVFCFVFFPLNHNKYNNKTL